jgi:type IV secretion system protein VirD4
MTEGIQFLGRPLLTSDEVRELLGGWQGDGWRYGITDIAGKRPFKTLLAVHEKSEICKQRIGMVSQGIDHDRHQNQLPKTSK